MTHAKEKPAPNSWGGLRNGEVSFGHEPPKHYSPTAIPARLILRSIQNDDGHFCGLEVAYE